MYLQSSSVADVSGLRTASHLSYLRWVRGRVGPTQDALCCVGEQSCSFPTLLRGGAASPHCASLVQAKSWGVSAALHKLANTESPALAEEYYHHLEHDVGLLLNSSALLYTGDSTFTGEVSLSGYPVLSCFVCAVSPNLLIVTP